jgi:hypothetical protein
MPRIGNRRISGSTCCVNFPLFLPIFARHAVYTRRPVPGFQVFPFIFAADETPKAPGAYQ